MEDIKLIITVDGGIVQSVSSNHADVRVMIVDRDTDGADPDEFLTQQDMKDFIEREEFREVIKFSGVSDEVIPFYGGEE